MTPPASDQSTARKRPYTKWTDERIETVRTLVMSGATTRQVAIRLDVGISALRDIAKRKKIRFGPADGQQFNDAVALEIRARWAVEMPRLRANVRSEVERIKAEGAAS